MSEIMRDLEKRIEQLKKQAQERRLPQKAQLIVEKAGRKLSADGWRTWGLSFKEGLTDGVPFPEGVRNRNPYTAGEIDFAFQYLGSGFRILLLRYKASWTCPPYDYVAGSTVCVLYGNTIVLRFLERRNPDGMRFVPSVLMYKPGDWEQRLEALLERVEGAEKAEQKRLRDLARAKQVIKDAPKVKKLKDDWGL